LTIIADESTVMQTEKYPSRQWGIQMLGYYQGV